MFVNGKDVEVVGEYKVREEEICWLRETMNWKRLNKENISVKMKKRLVEIKLGEKDMLVKIDGALEVATEK